MLGLCSRPWPEVQELQEEQLLEGAQGDNRDQEEAKHTHQIAQGQGGQGSYNLRCSMSEAAISDVPSVA